MRILLCLLMLASPAIAADATISFRNTTDAPIESLRVCLGSETNCVEVPTVCAAGASCDVTFVVSDTLDLMDPMAVSSADGSVYFASQNLLSLHECAEQPEPEPPTLLDRFDLNSDGVVALAEAGEAIVCAVNGGCQ